MARRAGARRAPKPARRRGTPPEQQAAAEAAGASGSRKRSLSATEKVARRVRTAGFAAALITLGTLVGVDLGTDRTTLSLFEPGDGDTGSPTAAATSASPTPAPAVVVPGVVFDQRILTVAELTRKYAAQGLTLVEGDPMKPTTFVISSFNILGSSHTGKKGAAAGPARAGRAGALVRRKGVSVVGLQEFQSNQVRPFLSAAGGFEAYPGSSQGGLNGENSIAWDPDEWELVQADTVGIPYFFGKPRQMPYVLLRNLQTGRLAWFSNFHNPADVFGCKCGGHRVAATNREAELARELTADGTPMFTTGDMNDRGGYACRYSAAGMHSADGVRTVDGSCRLVGNLWIDWIWGSAPVTFDDYNRDYSPRNNPRISDHPIITATATIDPAKDNEKCVKRVRDGKAYYFCPDPTAVTD